MDNHSNDSSNKGELFMTPKIADRKGVVSDADKRAVLSFINGFKNKSNVNTDDICKEVRGKE